MAEKPMCQQLLTSKPWVDTPEAEDYLRGEENGYVSHVSLVTLFGDVALRRLFVIAERMENGTPGKVRRELEIRFTKQERETLKRWRLRIRGWLLVTGVPRNGVRMSMSTYETLCKFADFFASV